MIKEDYVSFETAKLLKEKGFDEPTTLMIDSDGKIRDIGYKESNKNLHWTDKTCACFTHQMALKWLREVHKIIVEINMEDYITEVDGKLTITYSYTIWHFNRHLNEVGETDIRYTDEAIWDKESHNSYEQTVEAALLYVLKNLI